MVKQLNNKSKKDLSIKECFMKIVTLYRIKLKKCKKKVIIKSLSLVAVNKGFNTKSKKRT